MHVNYHRSATSFEDVSHVFQHRGVVVQAHFRLCRGRPNVFSYCSIRLVVVPVPIHVNGLMTLLFRGDAYGQLAIFSYFIPFDRSVWFTRVCYFSFLFTLSPLRLRAVALGHGCSSPRPGRPHIRGIAFVLGSSRRGTIRHCLTECGVVGGSH